MGPIKDNRFLLLLIILMATACVGNSIALRKTSIDEMYKEHLIGKRHTALDKSKLCKAIGCVNGYCKESELLKFRIVCECFPGYEGTLCERLKCPFPCGPHGTCSRKGQGVFCKCDKGYAGKTCDTVASNRHSLRQILVPQDSNQQSIETFGNLVSASRPTLFSLPSGTSSWYRDNAPEMKFKELLSHAIIDTAVKPDICAPSFQCYHGSCDRKAMVYGLFQCHCKPKYTGLFCEKRCTLNCQNGGTCMVLDDGHQFCSCPFNTTGLLCQKYMASR